MWHFYYVIFVLYKLQKIDEVGQIPFESTTKGIDPSKAAITALTGVENPAFPTIREWISGFLQDETEVRIMSMELHDHKMVHAVAFIYYLIIMFLTPALTTLLPSMLKWGVSITLQSSFI